MTPPDALTHVRMARLIADALKADDWSQAEFCRVAGVSQKHLCLVLNGGARTTAAQLDYWAFLLGRSFHVELYPAEETTAEANTPKGPS